MEQLREVASKMAIHSQIFQDETIEREGNYYVPMEALIDLYESGVPVQYFDNFYQWQDCSHKKEENPKN